MNGKEGEVGADYTKHHQNDPEHPRDHNGRWHDTQKANIECGTLSGAILSECGTQGATLKNVGFQGF